MAKAIVIYGSTTGNTESMANTVASGLEQGGLEVILKEVTDADVGELNNCDVIVIGCSTWGDGELQDDFIVFYEQLEGMSLDGKKAAVFGPGDSDGYPDTFCKAVDMIEERLKECGAQIIGESLKIDGDVEAATADIKLWSLKVAEATGKEREG